MFAIRCIVLLGIINLVISAFLWALQSLSMLLVILAYEALLILGYGVIQFLGSWVYREDSVVYRHGGRTAWWDFRRFAKLSPEERERYRQEGLILAVIGAIMMLLVLVARILTLA
jgi:hypothetical protein